MDFIPDQFHNNLRLSQVEKLSFDLTNIVCVHPGAIQMGSKKIVSPLAIIHDSSEMSSHGGPPGPGGVTSPLCVSLVNCPTSAREQRAASFSWWNLPNGANLLPLPSSCLFLCYLFITWQTLSLFIRSKMTTWPRFCETLVARWNCSSPGMSSRTTTFPLPHSVRTAWTTRCVCVCVCVCARVSICLEHNST